MTPMRKAEPDCRWQRSHWHSPTRRGFPSYRYRTAPHRQPPVPPLGVDSVIVTVLRCCAFVGCFWSCHWPEQKVQAGGSSPLSDAADLHEKQADPLYENRVRSSLPLRGIARIGINKVVGGARASTAGR